MSEWNLAKNQYSEHLEATPEEIEVIPYLITEYFVAQYQKDRIIFGLWNDRTIYRYGTKGSWQTIRGNTILTEADFRNDYPNQEFLETIDYTAGTARFKEKPIKWNLKKSYWTYLNNRKVDFSKETQSEEELSELTSSSGSSGTNSPAEEDTAKVEKLLERTESTVAAAISKLRQTSRSGTPAPSSPAQKASALPGSFPSPVPTQTHASGSLPTPPVSKGKQPAPAPPRTRTTTSALTQRPSTPHERKSTPPQPQVPKAGTSQSIQQPGPAPPPQPTAPQPPPGNPPPNPPAAAAMAQQNQPRIFGTAPDPYDGSSDKAIAFWNTLANYYSINDAVYTTDLQKVSSALTQFKIGTLGGEWASDQMAAALARNPVNYGTWAEFKAAFEKQFIPPC